MHVNHECVCFTETEQTVDYLMETLTVAAVQSKNWGGKYWSQLKRNPDQEPSWDKLINSSLWDDDVYPHVREYLAGRTTVVRSEAKNVISAAEGQVTTMSLSLRDRNKIFMYGPVLGVQSISKPKVLLVETNGPAVDGGQEAETAIIQDPTSHVILMGDTVDVERMLQRVQESASRTGQNIKRLHCFVEMDTAFSAQLSHEASKHILIALLTPTTHLISHRGYFVLKGLGLRSSIIASCLRCLNVPTSSVLRNLLYIPNQKRPLKSCIDLLGDLIVNLTTFQTQLGLSSRSVGDTNIFQSDVQSAVTMQSQSENSVTMTHELLAFFEGVPLTQGLISRAANLEREKRRRESGEAAVAGELTEQ